MNPKTIITAILLLFVGVCTFYAGNDLIMLTSVGLFGMAVATEQLINKGPNDRSGGPVGDAEVLYAGTLAFVDATGFLVASTASGVNLFGGVVPENVDNSAGADGDVQSDVWIRGQFQFTGSGFTQADVGVKAYASDNFTVTATSTSNTYIGTIRRVISSTVVVIDIDPHNPA